MVYFTKAFHRFPYDAISPSLPSLSQRGRTVLVTGATGGIGFAIARAFIDASAERVIITGRRDSSVNAAVTQLLEHSGACYIAGEVCDIADSLNAEALWSRLSKKSWDIDACVLNAADQSQVF
jgi:NAD(P)-dependent dehydrogenase (short-subunit alcohol dehydrogenase family)